VPGAKHRRWHTANELAQATPYAIALNSIADLLAYGKADPWRTGLLAHASLDDESACMRSRAKPRGLSGGPKVTTAFQPLHLASPT